MIEHESNTTETTPDVATTETTPDVAVASVPLTPEEHAKALRASAIPTCPWCSGTGQFWTTSSARVVCTSCDGSGEAARWQGPAADDWRRRFAAAYASR